jgi:PGF-pre-PGF domain-containing protein
MEELYINKIKFLLLTFLIFTLSSCVGTAADIHVQRGGSIQTAVNSAHSGDTIIVESGTYVGNIDITRGYAEDLNNLVIKAESNDPTQTVIIANNSAAATVEGAITIRYKTNVTITGFTISGASRTDATGAPNLAAVHLVQSKQCTVENNVFLNNGIGVKVTSSTEGANIIRNNNFNRTSAIGTGTGIRVEGSSNTMVSQNTVSNQKVGIYVSSSNSRGSTVSGNTLNKNTDYGIELESYAKGITVDLNTITGSNTAGIYLSSSSENTVTNNKIVMPGYQVNNNNTNAIVLYSESQSDTNSNVISNNDVTGAAHGIFSNGGRNNTVQNNKASGNLYGIAMRFSHNNRIINNNADGNDWGIFLTYQDSGNTVSENSANGCTNAGIYLNVNCGANNLVDKNTVKSSQYNGIYVETHGNKILNNLITGNSRGIYLLGANCYDNVISNNFVNYSSGNGIRLVNTSGVNRLVSNSIISNNGDGIYLYNANTSNIDSNIVQGNNIGIHAENSNGVTVNNNTASYNMIGVRFHITDNSTASKNTLTHSTGSGIDLNSAENNNVTGNSIISNEKGITLCAACRQNLFYNNNFNNPVNADAKNGANTWYITKTKAKNVVSGPYIGGNLWAAPSGDGFSQTATDGDGDGIADAIYTTTDGYIVDRYPLVSVVLPDAEFSMSAAQGIVPLTVQFTSSIKDADSIIWDFGDGYNSTEPNPAHTYSTVGNFVVTLTATNKNDVISKSATITVSEYKILPVADFSASSTSGYAPLSVQFTDASQNAAGWSWDFGDGTNSTVQSPAHTYNAVGTYTITQTVSNVNGTASKQATVTVQEQTSSSGSSGGSSSGSSGSSGSGGGGGGGSPEPQSNVEIKELSQTFISSGKAAKFEFTKGVTPVVYISFDSKKTAGKMTTIVEKLKAKSTLVSGLPSGEIYKHLNIWVGNGGFATSKNIENAAVYFKVEKSWVQDKKIDKASVTLNMYSDKKWNQLPTSLSSEDDKYLYYTAQTSGFSSFAITGKTTATENHVQPAAGNKTQPATGNETPTKTGNESAPGTQQTPVQKESPSSSAKKSPAFEVIYGIAGLLVVFLCRRRQ